MLVGDILLSAREAVPDLPQVLPAPTISAGYIAVSAVVSTNPLPSGTYFYQITYTTPWGETSPSVEGSITLDGTTGLKVDATGNPYLPVLSGANLYLGMTSGAEIQQYALALSVTTPTATTTAASTFAVSPPPLGNSAFLPDSGGSVASAAQIYRWFQHALLSIARANGGVPDVCGFRSHTGKALYKMPGDWKDIDAAWYDGYPLNLGSSKQVYRHNALTSVSGMMSYTTVIDQLICELFPQPVRTGGQTTTTAALSTTGDAVALNGMGGFVLSFGLVRFGTEDNVEFASFTAGNNGLVSMVRGLGGTDAQAWPIGTNVEEMNVMWEGWRAPSLYSVGDAYRTIRIPTDWIPLIHKYILSRYRLIEQQEEEATRLEKEFMDGMASATKRVAPIGERQIQPLDQTQVDVFPGLSRTFGGIIVP